MADVSPYRSPYVDLAVLKSAIYSDLNEFVAGSEHGLNILVEMNLALFERLNTLENDHSRICSMLQARDGKIDLLHQELDLLKHENDMLALKIASVDDSTRAMNLRVEGVPELQNENIKKVIADCLSKSGVSCTVGDIDFARRLGKAKQGQNRPILVRLQREGLRHAILTNKAKINQNSPETVWVNDDVSDVTRSLRKKVRDVVYLAKQNGISDIKIHSDGVIIDSIKYHHSDLDLLPPLISVQKAKSREEEDDIFFQGEESPFSNFYPSTITDEEGRVFHNLEQAFQFKKAMRHGKILLANKIARTRNPVVVKRLSKKIQPSKEWRQVEQDIMAELLMAKFSQNGDLAKVLLQTGEKQLHEATTDRIWAIGCGLSSRALTNEEWKGKDLLGQLLENTREAIRSALGPNLVASQEGSPDAFLPLSDDEDDVSDCYEECEGDGVNVGYDQTPLLSASAPLIAQSTSSQLPPSHTQAPSTDIPADQSQPASSNTGQAVPSQLDQSQPASSNLGQAASSQSGQATCPPTVSHETNHAPDQPTATQALTKKQRNPYRKPSASTAVGSETSNSSSQQSVTSPARKSRRGRKPENKDK